MNANILSPSKQSYDIIGDIHGYADTLRSLLEKLGYRSSRGVYSHPEERKVVFLGDYIDRGPQIRETLHIVRDMVDAGHALAVMGNHEYNAVCFHTEDGQGGYLRSRAVGEGKNVIQHQASLDAFQGREDEWQDWLSWFKKLPFALDLPGLRAVHATWSPEMVEYLSSRRLDDPEFLRASALQDTREFRAVETVLKGIELPLPDGHTYTDKQGHERPQIRVKWWDSPEGKTYRDLAFPKSDVVPEINVELEPEEGWDGYLKSEPPVFFGHYWLPSDLELGPVAPNAACLDYSVAKEGGKLVAYRWDGEQKLRANKFVQVPTFSPAIT